jgi:RNA polymerase sigma-70 factor (ECF subfamily)
MTLDLTPRAGREARLQALHDMYTKHSGFVRRVARRLVRDRTEVEDVIHDVFVIAAENAHRIESKEAEQSWLATVTVRCCARRRRRLREVPSTDCHDGSALPFTARPHGDCSVLVQQILRVLAGLSSEQRVAWTLRYVHDEPLARVAIACRCSLATVKRRIHAAHQTVVAAAGGRTD